MPSSIISYKGILARFDSLVALGVIDHVPSEVTEIEDDNGYKFQFEVTGSLAGKSALEHALKIPEHTPADRLSERPATFGPGSDIGFFHPDLLLSTINETHLFVFNKFGVFRPQLLLLTVDSYQRQHVPLTQADLAAAWTVLDGTDDHFYVFFNCGFTAGASRHHKHIQVIPHPDAQPPTTIGWRLFPDYDPPLPPGSVSFLHFLHRFDGAEPPPTAQELFATYSDLLGKCRRALDVPATEIACPHNLVMTKKWIVAIPRASENVDGTTANSAGMMGSVWLKNDAQLEKWISQGPSWVLSQLGMPSTKPNHTL